MPEPILKIEGLSKAFTSGKTKILAVNDISFTVEPGATVGIVGESGCGKTTLGRCVVNAHPATAGKVLYRAANGREYDLQNISKKDLWEVRREVQMIFQDPYSSLDPRMTVFDIISEPLRANFPYLTKQEMADRIKPIAEKVGLNASYLKRYPHAFSGGQRQRIGIARALVLYPKLIVCDECVSALDVSVQAQVVNLLKDLQTEMNLTYLFISHDLSVVEHISTKVGVMYLGRMVEYASTSELFEKPMHPYSEALLSAVPIADPDISLMRIPLGGEIPNPSNAPSGCAFHPRCRYATEACSQNTPVFSEVSPSHFSACMRVKELNLVGITAKK
ncbi:MAG: ATP-binding cassette domain-containing protein [Bacteroidales bacterium]|jgi:peptide/nickel transport system ATP-binding protein|nr:ATP-binding cassette domain-containing protein [Bacteroidales bacterium]